MKKLLTTILSFCVLLAANNTNAQTTNTFPPSGNAGVGTTNPNSTLQVAGTVTIDSSVVIRDSLRVDSGMVVGGKTRLKGNLVVTGDVKVKGKLRAKDKLVVDSIARLKDRLVVEGKAKLKSDAVVFGNLKIKSLQDNTTTNDRILVISPNGNILASGDMDPPVNGCVALIDAWYRPTQFEPKIALCSNYLQVYIGDEPDFAPHTDYKLSVYGKIVAKKYIATELNWYDDELQRDLTFKDLELEEQFVKKNSHLMDIPSGKEVEKDGIDLAEMSGFQMRKIEQVFLYLFKFNKIIKKLKNENKQLKKHNKRLKGDFADLEKRVEALEHNN